MKYHRTYITLISVFISLYLNAGTGKITINEDFKDLPLKEVFKIFDSKYNIKVAFVNKYVQDVRITVALENVNVHDAFEQLLRSTSLSFELITDNTVILRKKKEVEGITNNKIFPLTGVVSESGTGERLPYAYVWMEPGHKSFTTNVEGFFSIPEVSEGTKLRISYLGYEDVYIDISDANRERQLHVSLMPLVNQLDEIIVQDEISKIRDFKVEQVPGKLTLSPTIAKRAPSAGEVDVFRTMQLLPGINATNEVSSGLRIEGGTSNQNLVLFDGFTVYHVDHFFGYFSAFNPLAIKSLQLYKTGFEAKYGGRVSSVVDITGVDGNRNKTSGTIGLNLLSANTSIEVPLSDNGATLFFSGRRSYTDIWSSSLFENIFSIFKSTLTGAETSTDPKAPVPTSLNSTIKPDFYYSDLNLKFSSRLGVKNHIAFSFYDSHDILNYTGTINAGFQDTLSIVKKNIGLVSWGNVGSSLKLSRQWNNNHYSSMLMSYSYYKSNFDQQTTTTSTSVSNGESVTHAIQAQNNDIEDISLKLDHIWEFNTTDKIETGLAASLYSTQLQNNLDDSVLVNEQSGNQMLIAHYLQGTVTPSEKLTITPGLRSSYLTLTNKFYIEPRLSFTYNISPNWWVNGASGIYYQFINQSYTKNVLDGSRDFWILANGKDVPVQKATHYLLGINHRKGPYTINVNYFQKNFTGLMEYAFQNGSMITEFKDPHQVFAVGQGNSEGMELLIKRNFGRFESWVSYTLSKVRYQFPQINGGQSYYADFDQRHEINWIGIYSVGDFEFSATWIYGSGKPYTPLSGLQSKPPMGSPMNRKEGPHIDQFTVQEKNSARLPAYHRMDISASYKLNLGNTKSRISLNIFNLYNHHNVLDKKIQVIQPGNTGRMQRPITTLNNITLMGTTVNMALEVSF